MTIGVSAAVAFLAALELWLPYDASTADTPKSGLVGNRDPKRLPLPFLMV